MPPPNSNGSVSTGTGYERKKKSLSNIPLSPSVATSSARPSPATYYSHPNHRRSPSPPASAYFPSLSADTDSRFRPTPNAESHFAYSTTLRRHHTEGAAALRSPAVFAAAVNAEVSSWWTRAINIITGRQHNEYQRVEHGASDVGTKNAVDTASAKFAHYPVDVSPI